MHRHTTSLSSLGSILRPLLALSLALPIAACATDDPDASTPATAADPRIAQLIDELADVPGDLVITSAADLPFSAELGAKLATAGKVIHAFGDGRVIAYVGSPANAPAGARVERLFRERGGDIVIADQKLLADYLAQEEHPAGLGKGGVADAVGLPIGHGALWPESTVAYVIDGGLSASEAAAVRSAVSTWNTKVDPSGVQIKVRFVPRYWADNRPYVRFVKGGGGCGSSQVGRHDNIFTNWWSHDITLNCFGEGTIHHEMGHTAGLYHEQQRCDRDSFVNVRYTADGVNCARLCGGDSASYGPYNYLSVMHYYYSSDPAACSIAQITPTSSYYRGTPAQGGTGTTLDTYDVQAINQMYYGRPSLPAIGASTFYSFPAQYTAKIPVIGGGSLAEFAPVILWDRYAGVRDQHWAIVNSADGYVEIRNRNSGKCMEDANFGTANGSAVVQYTCWGGDNQKWIVAPSAGASGYFDIINKYSGKALDIPGGSNSNGVAFQQWDHTNGSNQRFLLSPAY